MLFTNAINTVNAMHPVMISGRVAQVRGLTVVVDDLPLPIGAAVNITHRFGQTSGEIVGFQDDATLVMLFGNTTGIKRGDRVIGSQTLSMASVSENLIGRVVNGFGQPIDGKGPIRETTALPLQPKPVDPMLRTPIDQPLGTGVRSIDGLLSVGRGQRMGIFAGPGVGKSTLMGMIARRTDADISVIALIGERGRELRDFIERSLGEEGLARSVVIVATSDEPELLRIRAANYAASVAEYFRDTSRDVVFMMDSVTRYCLAQRQIGLSTGEPPATRGFPPSVFANLPRLLERAGRTESGSITGFYTILVEGDDLSEPISDTVRGILDGHAILSRKLANQGHFPAVDVLESISRVATDVASEQQIAAAREIRKLISNYREVEDLLNIGAYAPGSNPDFDIAIHMKPAIDQFLQQQSGEIVSFEQTSKQLINLALNIAQQSRVLSNQQRAQAAG